MFIIVNSVSAFSGLDAKGIDLQAFRFDWLTDALAGGLAGSYMGNRKWNQPTLRKALALLLLIASVKLITL